MDKTKTKRTNEKLCVYILSFVWRVSLKLSQQCKTRAWEPVCVGGKGDYLNEKKNSITMLLLCCWPLCRLKSHNSTKNPEDLCCNQACGTFKRPTWMRIEGLIHQLNAKCLTTKRFVFHERTTNENISTSFMKEETVTCEQKKKKTHWNRTAYTELAPWHRNSWIQDTRANSKMDEKGDDFCCVWFVIHNSINIRCWQWFIQRISLAINWNGSNFDMKFHGGKHFALPVDNVCEFVSLRAEWLPLPLPILQTKLENGVHCGPAVRCLTVYMPSFLSSNKFISRLSAYYL